MSRLFSALWSVISFRPPAREANRPGKEIHLLTQASLRSYDNVAQTDICNVRTHWNSCYLDLDMVKGIVHPKTCVNFFVRMNTNEDIWKIVSNQQT